MAYGPLMRILLLVSVLLLSGNLPSMAQPEIVCPRATSVDMSTQLHIADPNKAHFTEISGLGFSPTLKGPSGKPLLYLMNDGGGGRRFGIYDSGTGIRVKSLRLPRDAGFNIDFEGMSVGSCGMDEEDSTCIYIADVGDNTARNSGGSSTGIWAHNRTAYPIYKIREPDPNVFNDDDVLPDSYVTTLNFNYFHSSSPTRYADCEAFFVDNVGWGAGGAIGDLYILTKWSSSSTNTRLFKIPAHAWDKAKSNPNFVFSPTAVGDYSNGLSSNAISGHRWTRADMTLDGTIIALGDYYDQYLYLRCPGMSVTQTLAVPDSDYCETWPLAYWDSQFEAIAWTPDGAMTLEISECTSSYCRGYDPTVPMVFTQLDYKYYPSTSQYCRSGPTASPSMAPSAVPSFSSMPSVSSAPSPAPTVCSSVLYGAEKLYSDKEPRFICSPNGVYMFGFRPSRDDALSLWRLDNNGGPLEVWSTESCCGATEIYLHMQYTDANLVLYGNVNGDPSYVLWATGSNNFDFSGSELSVEDDGQARIRYNGTEIWSTGNGLVYPPTPSPTPVPTPKPSAVEALPAPTPRPTCPSYQEKDLCKDADCRWKGGLCIVRKQMRRG